MTAVILTPTLTGHDGLSCLARQFVSALAAIDSGRVDVLSLAHTESSSTWPAHVTVTGCGGRRATFAWRAWRAAHASHASHVVVLHAHLLPAAWPLVRAGATLVPVLVGVEAWRPLSWARRRVLMQARRALAISHHTAREFVRSNADFASLPIDVCWPATPSMAAAAPAAPIRSHPFALIVGRLSAEERYKGHDLLIDVWPDVMKAASGARLVVVGTGDDEARLRRRVADAGLSDAIEFAGAQGPAELSALYRDCSFLVMPSRHEGFGFVFLEAMSAGRACIGSRGAAEEIIVAGTTGLIVDPGQPREVRDAIVTLFHDPQLCARFGAEGRHRAGEVFSTARFTRELSQYVAGFMRAETVAAC